MKKDIEFSVSGEQLHGLFYLTKEPDSSPAVLIIGGGANIPHKEGYYPAWQEEMLTRGISSMSFDFRGVGLSEGELSKTNLNTRLEDANAATNILKKSANESLYLAGISMGAPVAIRLANIVKPEGLILISPAAYTSEAWGASFGPEFSGIIRTPNSWKSSPDFEALKDYSGKKLLAYGVQDEVIPNEILKEYERIVSESGEVLAFEEVGHRFMREDDSVSVQARKRLYQSIESIAKD